MFVCLYPINIKTAEPIGPTIFEATHMTQGKVSGFLEFKKISTILIAIMTILFSDSCAYSETRY